MQVFVSAKYWPAAETNNRVQAAVRRYSAISLQGGEIWRNQDMFIFLQCVRNCILKAEGRIMFDVNGVSERIHNARIKKNMTQSNLADELGVSFQAISNWERGNSLPDISKYEDLCRILDINLEELLGFGAESKTVSKILKSKNHEETAPVTVEEIVPIAPILPPEDLKDTLRMQKEQYNMETGLMELLGLVPFLDQQTINEMMENAVPEDISELIAAAPFLSKENMRKLLEGWQKNKPEDKKVSPGSLAGLAPFLDRKMFEMLLDHVEMEENDINQIMALAPFASENSLKKLLEKASKI